MNRTKETKYAMKMRVVGFFSPMNNSSSASIHENKNTVNVRTH